ncbi:hypothetical protein V8G54_015549 [Vigna mungo]|uniref:Integrase catalytic domain-containing protein n=1 Tax=Vigna mungo TaxID=3915 RepID=A0AAQ3RWY3_VIGMU
MGISLETKEGSEPSFQTFIQIIKDQFETTFKRVRSDNARDFSNQTLSPFFNEQGIIHEFSCVNTPEQKGVEPIPDINEEQNMVVIEVQDLPIAVRKGVGAYTRKPRYPWSHFVSYDKISSNHKSFLGHLNTVTIPKTIDEALNIKD